MSHSLVQTISISQMSTRLNRDKLKLKVKKMDNSNPRENEEQVENKEVQKEDVPSGQPEIARPIFSDEGANSVPGASESAVDKTLSELRNLMEIKHNLNTVQEGLNLAKGAKMLPPYMKVEVMFTPRHLEHYSRAIMRTATFCKEYGI